MRSLILLVMQVRYNQRQLLPWQQSVKIFPVSGTTGRRVWFSIVATELWSRGWGNGFFCQDESEKRSKFVAFVNSSSFRKAGYEVTAFDSEAQLSNQGAITSSEKPDEFSYSHNSDNPFPRQF